MHTTNYAAQAFADLEKFLTPVLDMNATGERMKKGEYPFIALPLADFCQQMEVVSGFFSYPQPKNVYVSGRGYVPTEYKRPVFVDVGCGIGTKLVVAKQFSKFDLVGIECYAPYVEVAQELASHAKIIEGNALDMDYSAYDVIYFYCPSCDHEMQKKLEARIIATMKPGAYVLANLPQSGDEVWAKHPMRLVWRERSNGYSMGNIFQKVE